RDPMTGPFPLPADVKAGDFIEIGQLGAYGQAMRTGFNGFGEHDVAIVSDPPMLSLIPGEGAPALPDNVTPLIRRQA
ncbi:MAG: type III PLP-dependent enzyme, partial [Sphingomonadaceae bacterium]